MRLNANVILGGVDVTAFKAAVKGTFMGKYGVSLRHGSNEAVEWARAFKLDTMPPCRVLDIACGSSIFARVCNVIGHDATAIDQPGYMHAELARLMGVRFVEHKVTAADPLPILEPGFGTITMMHMGNHEGDDLYRELSRAVWDILEPGGVWWVVFHFVAQRWARSQKWAEWFDGDVTQAGSRLLRLEKKA